MMRSQRSAPVPPGLALLLVALIAPGACAHARLSPVRAERGLWIVAAGADVVSTSQALDRGAVEQNPLLGRNPSDARLIGTKVVAYALTSGIEGWMRGMQPDHELPRWVEWLVWSIGTIGYSLVSWHNYGAGR